MVHLFPGQLPRINAFCSWSIQVKWLFSGLCARRRHTRSIGACRGWQSWHEEIRRAFTSFQLMTILEENHHSHLIGPEAGFFSK